MFQQDWVMRQIDMLVRFVSKTILKKDSVQYEIHDEASLSDTDLLYLKLKDLVARRRLCEAEDLLFDNFKKEDPEYLALALDFYQSLNRLTGEELEAHDFSRQEVEDGVREIMHRSGLPDFLGDSGE